MVCPYCSTDMEPIELSGKVFCSNCGLTIKNNQPTQVPNAVTQSYQKVENVATDAPEEVQFPVVPEVVEALEQKTENSPDMLMPSSVDGEVSAITDNPVEAFNPITQAAAVELGIEPTETLEAVETADDQSLEPILGTTQMSTPEAESRIPDISIPSESDFDTIETTGGTEEQSYVALANPGNESDILSASSILLDILGEEKPKEDTTKATEPRKIRVDVLKDKPQNPVEYPQLEPAVVAKPDKVKEIDEKTAKKIENLEEKIEKMPEPIVEIPAEDLGKYDPDTIKSDAIKGYFSSALSEARNKPHSDSSRPKTKTTTKPKPSKKAKKKIKEHGPALIFALTLAGVTATAVGVLSYYFVTTFVGI